MLISSNKDDVGYSNFIEARGSGKTVRIYLDGEEVEKCTIADDVEGFVVRAVLDSDGQLQADPRETETVWEERVEGDVRIVIA